MKLYSCVVRLSGSTDNAVHKVGVTAPEIAILKYVHGQSEKGHEPVVNIKVIGAVKRREAEERARLATTYSHGDVSGFDLVQKILGVDGVPLPQFVPGVDDPEDDTDEGNTGIVEAEAPPVEKPKRTRIERRGEGGRIVSAAEAPAESGDAAA